MLFGQGQVKFQLSWELISDHLNQNSVLILFLKHIDPHDSMSSNYLQALTNSRADAEGVQVALAHFASQHTLYHKVKGWGSDLSKCSFIQTIYQNERGQNWQGQWKQDVFFLHIIMEKLFSKSPKKTAEWDLCCNIQKWVIQADLANHSNVVFLAQPLRQPPSPDCSVFANNSAPLSSPLPALTSVVLTSVWFYIGVIWPTPLYFRCLPCSLTPLFLLQEQRYITFCCSYAVKCHLEQTCPPHITHTSAILPKWWFAQPVASKSMQWR